MAKITDPAGLEVYVHATSAAGASTQEVIALTGPKTLQLTLLGGLNDTAPGKTSGVTAKALYSFLKEEWLNGTDAATLRRFKFPLKMIFEGSFIWVNGWAPADAQTRDLFRDAGFQEGVSLNENSCLISLGSMDDSGADLAYYTQAAGFTVAPTDYDKTGELNENVDITGNTTYLKSFLREEGKLFSEYNLLGEQGLSVISFQAYSFPLSNGEDLKRTLLSTADSFILGANSPYQNMEINYLKGTRFSTYATATTYIVGDVVFDPAIQANGSTLGTWWFCSATTGDSSGANTGVDTGNTWASYFGEEQIGGEWYAFNRIVTCATGTDLQAYGFMQANLRATGDINADNVGITAGQGGFGVVNGEVAAPLAEYVGDTLKPQGGVLLRGFDANSTNSIVHRPISVDAVDAVTGDIGIDSESVPLVTTDVGFPFVAAGNFNFGTNIVGELDAETFYTVYFEYVTRKSGSYTLTLSAGDTGDLTWASTDLDHISAADYVNLTGFTTTPAMNGLYLVNTTGAGTMNVTLQTGVTLVTETATVQVDQNPFESPTALIVKTDGGGTPVDMSGVVDAASIAWDFDYTNNNQGGRKDFNITPAPAPIIVVAQALTGAEWVEASHTISASVGQNIAINPGDERNYAA